ncbi:MAG TPA: riboflavin synthase [Terriglobales bacterium]|nr:riboflavin synthase [Terriglobales bacterium]
MFTGIIEEVGRVAGVQRIAGRKDAVHSRITVEAPAASRELKKGDSVAVSGVCLTAVEITPGSFSADLAAETVARTSFGRIATGARVNLELPMPADGRMGGHVVQGHVDGVAKFVALTPVEGGDDYWLQVEIPPQLAKYVVFKGSIAIEGISLTVARIEGTTVTCAIIPHTVEATNLVSLHPGDALNLEVDILAKYAEKMLQGEDVPGEITLERLVREGF